MDNQEQSAVSGGHISRMVDMLAHPFKSGESYKELFIIILLLAITAFLWNTVIRELIGG